MLTLLAIWIVQKRLAAQLLEVVLSGEFALLPEPFAQ
jgi:hypothetical protein